MKAGTAEVTATFNNSEGTEIKATCKVTVTAQETENKTLTDGNYQVNAEAGGKDDPCHKLCNDGKEWTDDGSSNIERTGI